MVREYELMYIVRPDVDEDGLRQATDSVESLIGTLGGEVERTTLWGKRRLAYEVKHLRDGHYVISHLKLDGEKVKDMERALRIHDTVFRHLLVLREGLGELTGGEEKNLSGEDEPTPRADAEDEDEDADEAGESSPVAVAAGAVSDTTAATDDDQTGDDAGVDEEE
jgi:small subunit ribosomal protein S6